MRSTLMWTKFRILGPKKDHLSGLETVERVTRVAVIWAERCSVRRTLGSAAHSAAVTVIFAWLYKIHLFALVDKFHLLLLFWVTVVRGRMMCGAMA